MNLFAYGTLMLPDVFERVAGRRLESRGAVLVGFERKRLAQRTYPAIVPNSGSRVAGRLYCNIADDVRSRLDHFEGPLYERRAVIVLLDAGTRLPAEAYVLGERYMDLIEPGTWSLEEFLAGGAHEFLTGYEGFDRLDREG